jgi:hypothetical protein
MNPITWTRDHQIALVIAIILGALIGVIVGYFAYAATAGMDGAVSMGAWLHHPLRRGAGWSAGLGAGIVGGAFCCLRLALRQK